MTSDVRDRHLRRTDSGDPDPGDLGSRVEEDPMSQQFPDRSRQLAELRDAYEGDAEPTNDYFSEQTSDPACPFCARIEANDYEQSYNAAVVRFEPLNSVTPGHMLFVPSWHVEHPSQEAIRLAMGYAEGYAGRKGEAFNLITSSGSAATQSIPHIHVHYVPRRDDDGLTLPWTGQGRSR